MTKLTSHFLFLFALVYTTAMAAWPPMNYAANTIYTRSLSMGGAFTAMESGIENALYNPAAMQSRTIYNAGLDIFLSPVGGTSALLSPSELSQRNDKDAYDWLSAVGLFARALTFSNQLLQLSLVLSEELPDNPEKLDEKKIVSTRGHLDWNYHMASMRLSLAKQVSLGVTGYAFNMLREDELRNNSGLMHRFGASYGILMRPSDNLTAGVSYFKFPAKVDSLMLMQHRITDKSVNIGVVYNPFPRLSIALDFRNVSEEENNSTNEVHAGIEFVPTRFLALRTGYYRQNLEKIDTVAAGFGLGDYRSFVAQTDRFVFSNIILNYALEIASVRDDPSYAHYLTFLIRF